ncbi:MAG: threonine synthase, partial [Erysipelotrichaceae bacterium]|nr:threonine synthase [Erysipelotrichaceae bacterium]
LLSDFIQTGVYDANRPFYTSMSPSIDILISSNVERLLYLVSQDPDWVAGKMKELKENRKYTVEKEYFEKIRETFCGYYLPEEQCAKAMYEACHEDHRLIDPHTAVAYGCMKQYRHDDVPCVVLATASPYKFASAVLQSIGEEPAENGYDSMRKLCEVTGEPVPASLADLKHKEVRFTQVLPKETAMEELWKKLEVLYD